MVPAARKHKPPGPRHFSSLIKYHSHCVPSATASPLAKPRVKGWEIGPTSRQTELQRTYGHLPYESGYDRGVKHSWHRSPVSSQCPLLP